MPRLLIVDDEPNLRRVLGSDLRLDGHTVDEAEGVSSALPLLASRDYDVVITDQKMPDGDGLAVLAAARENDPSLAVIVLTAVPTIELAVESMRRGAFDFITKPFNPEVVRATVRRACERTSLVRENRLLKTAVGTLLGEDQLSGHAEGIRRVREPIARVAPTDATVLIVGETGTGKELVARAIHEQPARAEAARRGQLRRVRRDAARERALRPRARRVHRRRPRPPGPLRGRPRRHALPRRGGRDAAGRAGQAAARAGGRPGAAGRVHADAQVDVRVLTATHRDLQERVAQGRFREDLYYRLAVFPVRHPAAARAEGGPARPVRGALRPDRPRPEGPADALSAPPRSRSWRATTSRATSASCATCSSARTSWRGPRRSAPTTSRWTSRRPPRGRP